MDSILLFLLLKYPSKLGDQRGSTPYALLSDHPQQVFRIHIAMGSRLLQIFQSLLPVSTDTISEIVNLTKLVFRIGIAVLRCHTEAAEGFLHILPAFFLEVDFTGKIGRRSDTRFRESLQQWQSSGNILLHQFPLTKQLSNLVLGKGIVICRRQFQIFHRLFGIIF